MPPSRLTRSFILPVTVASILGLAALRDAAAQSTVIHEFDPHISAADFSAHVQVLASDGFGGRAPDTDGERKTTRYLAAMLQRLGLEPGNGESYFQTVPVIASVVDGAHARMSIASSQSTQSLKFGEQVVFSSGTAKADFAIADSPVVFVGYGIEAPEKDWNDYAGIDVSGKTVVVLVGIPGDHPGEAAVFDTQTVTYYGRASYKFEQAARKGAAAAIVIHDPRDAGFEWDYVKARGSTVQFDLPAKDDPQPYPSMHGWIAADAAKSVFDAAGVNLRDLRAQAGKRGFKASALGDAKLSAAFTSTLVTGESKNVIAKLTGTKYPNEAVVYSAHWDHLGTHVKESGDNIYNGAIDNATGVAAVLEIAAQFAAEDAKPERSVIFLIPTLEESGLLGSKYYTLHPVVPLANTVVDINFDVMVPIGRAKNFVVVGLGMSELDDVVKPFATAQGRSLAKEEEKDSFFRSDHLNFARAGVPVLYMRGGTESREGGADAHALWRNFGKRYHTPADSFDPRWDLRGIVEDLEISYEVGKKLASSHDWPNYHADSAFRWIRDTSRGMQASARR